MLKIRERLFNGELLLVDEEFVLDKYNRIVCLGKNIEGTTRQR